MSLIANSQVLRRRLAKNKMRDFIPMYLVIMKTDECVVVGEYSKKTSMVEYAHDIVRKRFIEFCRQNPENIFAHNFMNKDFKITDDHKLLQSEDVKVFTTAPKIWLREVNFFQELHIGL